MKPFYPHRNDKREAWLKAQRDQHEAGTSGWVRWNDLLNEHRMKADYGLALDEDGGDP